MHPILFKIGDFPIRSFSVMVLLGVLAATWWVGRGLRAQGVTDEGALDHLLRNTLILGFIGARITYLIIHPEAYEDIVSLIAVWKGGIVSYGGFFGGALGGWLFARKRKLSMARLSDVALPGLLLGQAFGRVGCLLVGDDHGRPWDGAWAISFPATEGSLIPPELVGVPLHPSQIYLSLMNLIAFGAMAWLFGRRRFDGQVAVMSMVLYAVGRFLVEFTRGDDRARGIFGGFSTAQCWSLATLVIALIVFMRVRRNPAPPDAAGA